MYNVLLEDTAKMDLQKIVDFYEVNANLEICIQFLDDLENSFNSLKTNPSFQIRYNNVHCLSLNKFPFMLHFKIEQENLTCIIYGIISTHQDPSNHWIY